jgi:hypothetical protein
MHEGHHDEHEKEQRIVEGPYSQATSGIEILEIAFYVLRVDKNPRDQESGQDEEKVNAHPAIGKEVLQMQ